MGWAAAPPHNQHCTVTCAHARERRGSLCAHQREVLVMVCHTPQPEQQEAVGKGWNHTATPAGSERPRQCTGRVESSGPQQTPYKAPAASLGALSRGATRLVTSLGLGFRWWGCSHLNHLCAGLHILRPTVLAPAARKGKRRYRQVTNLGQYIGPELAHALLGGRV